MIYLLNLLLVIFKYEGYVTGTRLYSKQKSYRFSLVDGFFKRFKKSIVDKSLAGIALANLLTFLRIYSLSNNACRRYKGFDLVKIDNFNVKNNTVENQKLMINLINDYYFNFFKEN